MFYIYNIYIYIDIYIYIYIYIYVCVCVCVYLWVGRWVGGGWVKAGVRLSVSGKPNNVGTSRGGGSAVGANPTYRRGMLSG